MTASTYVLIHNTLSTVTVKYFMNERWKDFTKSWKEIAKLEVILKRRRLAFRLVLDEFKPAYITVSVMYMWLDFNLRLYGTRYMGDERAHFWVPILICLLPFCVFNLSGFRRSLLLVVSTGRINNVQWNEVIAGCNIASVHIFTFQYYLVWKVM